MTIQLDGKTSMAGHFHIHQPVDVGKVIAAMHDVVAQQPAFTSLHVRGGGDDGSFLLSFQFPLIDEGIDESDTMAALIREIFMEKLKLKQKQVTWSVGRVLATI